MNKIKVLYDVVKAMKGKEAFSGTLTVQVHKDETPLLLLRNEFEKNLLTGHTKAKINTELDYEGKVAKHESNTEFTIPHSGENHHHRHHEFIRHLHPAHAAVRGGLKGKLSKLAFALSILTALQTEEQEGKTIISLNAKDLPEDTKTLLREKVSRADACQRHGHGFLKEFVAIEHFDFAANMFINKLFEVEKVVITFVGTQKDEQNVPHDLTIRAELSLSAK